MVAQLQDRLSQKQGGTHQHPEQENLLMENTSSFVELAYSSIPVFADDGTIDLEELNFLLGIALKDGKIDSDEQRVLKNIFKQVDETTVTPTVWKRIVAVKKKYDL
jgi:hypothetical protein